MRLTMHKLLIYAALLLVDNEEQQILARLQEHPMTRLTFTGMRNRKPITITWEDGELSGDPDTVAWIKYYAAAMEGSIVGPVGGPYSTTDHLSDPYAASELIHSIFPGSVKVEGELPLRSAPPGAIL